eukprot:m.26009 g.26009  ORF g.26009 m.26009 type:complete len:307 (+) comp15238_c1_seq1:183-1103(+)
MAETHTAIDEETKKLSDILPSLSPSEIMGLAQHNSIAWKSRLAGSHDDVEQLLSSSPTEVSNHVTTVLGFKNVDRDARQAIVRDYFIGVLWFSKNAHLSTQSTSALMQIMGALLENCKGQMSLADNVSALQTYMQGRSSSDAEFDAQGKLFDFPFPTVPAVVEFVKTSLFQHYTMYQMLYSVSRATKSTSITQTITVPTLAAPLDEAVTQSAWDAHHTPPPTTIETSESITVDDTNDLSTETVSETTINTSEGDIGVSALTDEEIQQIIDFTTTSYLDNATNDVKIAFGNDKDVLRQEIIKDVAAR